MPLLFLLFIAFATGAFAAYSGREEVRLSADPVWRMESFLGYALFVAFVLLPATILFYAFHGDWFLFYFVDTSRAPWLIGLLVALAVAGAAWFGFQLGGAFCRASRDTAARRLAAGALISALAIWPLAWSRLSVVGTYRQYTRDYGLTSYVVSPAFYSGVAILLIMALAFGWLAYGIDRQTGDAI